MRLVLLVIGLVFVGGAPADDKRPRILERKPRTTPRDATELEKVLLERYNTAVDEVQIVASRLDDQIHGADEDLRQAVVHLVDAELDLAKKQAERETVLAEYVAFLAEAERILKEQLQAGAKNTTLREVKRAQYLRLDAEARLLREKQQGKEKPR
jgi:hypothetical protein